jgi:hypothetical protein
MTWWTALLVDALAFLIGVAAWESIVWGPPTILCFLWYTGAVREHTWLLAFVILPPMFGLFLLWVAKGLYNRKLGRLILVFCFSFFAVLLLIFAVVSRHGGWQMLPAATMYVFALAIAGVGIAKRKAIKERI